MDEKGLYKDGFEEYPIATVIAQNLLFLVYFGIGFIGMLPLKIFDIPLISVLYAVSLVIMLVFVLRKHICTNCYYYGKRCSTGWGKLSSLMFKERSGNYRLGVKLAGITWGGAILIPILGMILCLILDFTLYKVILLGSFILLSPIVFIYHKNSCKRCKMKDICPASMVKESK